MVLDNHRAVYIEQLFAVRLQDVMVENSRVDCYHLQLKMNLDKQQSVG
jgi:hypothetical protein